MIKKLFAQYFELAFWVAGITMLALSNPAAQSHFTLCPLKSMGLTWCPGCGLGHSIAWLFRANVAQSFQAHWFGIPALLIISWRIIQLARLRLAGNKLTV